MAVGNFVGTVETLVLELRFKAKMKRAKNRQDRPRIIEINKGVIVFLETRMLTPSLL